MSDNSKLATTLEYRAAWITERLSERDWRPWRAQIECDRNMLIDAVAALRAVPADAAGSNYSEKVHANLIAWLAARYILSTNHAYEVAQDCDEHLDRSGRLLGEVRAAALASPPVPPGGQQSAAQDDITTTISKPFDPATERLADTDLLGRLVDWTYLHATEGQAWPSNKTKKELIAQARHAAPIQTDAEVMKTAAPKTDTGAQSQAPVALTDLRIIIAGIRQFGLAPDGSDLRDLEAAIVRLSAPSPTVAGREALQEIERLCRQSDEDTDLIASIENVVRLALTGKPADEKK
jgi:hypothetical protein